MRRADLIAFALLLLVGAVAPLLVYPAFLTKLLCFAIFAMAFNLLVGYTGLLSFGHAMFFGGAAYVSGHAMKVWGWSPELAVLTGMASAAVMGLLVGLIVINEVGPWKVRKGVTQVVRQIITVTPSTKIVSHIRVNVRGRFGGDFLEVPLQLSDVALGDFVTVECRRERGQLIASSIAVAEVGPAIVP